MFRRIFGKAKKGRYKVTCLLKLNDDLAQKVNIEVYAYSRKKAMERVRNEVEFKVIKAAKQRIKQ